MFLIHIVLRNADGANSKTKHINCSQTCFTINLKVLHTESACWTVVDPPYGSLADWDLLYHWLPPFQMPDIYISPLKVKLMIPVVFLSWLCIHRQLLVDWNWINFHTNSIWCTCRLTKPVSSRRHLQTVMGLFSVRTCAQFIPKLRDQCCDSVLCNYCMVY